MVELLESSGPRIWEAVQVLVDLVNQGSGGAVEELMKINNR